MRSQIKSTLIFISLALFLYGCSDDKPSILSISSITPTNGVAGVSVTITGSAFSRIPSDNKVDFNGVQATVTSSSETNLSVVVPESTTGLVSVAVNGKSVSGPVFSYDLLVSDVSPKSGPPNSSVTITGSGFGKLIDENKVFFNGIIASITSVSANQIVVNAPSGATSGPVTVTVNGKSAQGPIFSFYNLYAFGRYGSFATYWKDGIAVNLSTDQKTAEIYDLAVSGIDIHAVGYIDSTYYRNGSIVPYLKPAYWKNGVKVEIKGISANTQFKQVAVSGNDVYIAGTTYMSSNRILKYWKNGVETLLPVNSKTSGEVNDVKVIGSDVYVAGLDFPNATYWKNSTPNQLTNDGLISRATGIFVRSQDVYVSSYRDFFAQFSASYWKNKVEIKLHDPNKSTGIVNDIVVEGSDVYVCGSESQAGSRTIAKYWKNGISYSLTDGTHSMTATAIAVLNGDVFTLVGGVVDKNWQFIYKNTEKIPPFPITQQFTIVNGIFLYSF